MEAQLRPSYNCAHFVTDVWLAETGQDISGIMGCFLHLPKDRQAGKNLIHDLKRLDGPQEPCIVLFRRVKATPHVGIFLRKRVLHLTDSGPIRQLLDVARIGYHSVRFYAPRQAH